MNKLFRLSIAVLLFISMIISITSCAAKKSENQAGTSETPSKTPSETVTVGDLTYELNAAPETLTKEQLDKFRVMLDNDRIDKTENFDNFLVKHYGTYNGAVVFFVEYAPSESNLLSYERLPNDVGTIYYSNNFYLRVYYNEDVKSLSTALRDDCITLENLQAIREYHEQNTYKLAPFEKPETLAFKENAEANTLTQDEKQNLVDWYNYNKDSLDYPLNINNFWRSLKHYGNYDGYVVLFGRITADEGVIQVVTTKKIGEYSFTHTIPFSIYLFKDGQFIVLNDELLENGVVDETFVGKIWEYHDSVSIL